MMRLLPILLLLLLSACNDSARDREFALDSNGEPTGLPKELVVVTRNAPTTWYQGREETEGPEYDLIKSFAEHHGIPFRFEIVDSIGEVLDWISQGKAHIAAAGLTDTEERREQGFIFGPEYYQVQQQVENLAAQHDRLAVRVQQPAMARHKPPAVEFVDLPAARPGHGVIPAWFQMLSDHFRPWQSLPRSSRPF